MSANVLFTSLVQLLLLWLAISVHESAKAWTAGWCGDPTARDLGRATLNPLRHLDLLGSLLFPGLLLMFGWPVFGWGRPAPVAEGNLRRSVRDGVLVMAAGSFANLIVVGVATVAIVVMVRVLGPEARQGAFLTLVYQAGAEQLRSFPLMFTLVRLASINAFVAVFNLIPLPPLDGGQIALNLLPPDWAARLAALRPYGFMIGVLAAIGLVPLLLVPFYGILGLVINLS
ncbi:MAG TPA: site-2 protease family protein [Thermoanaerobaculia bacterium]|jgi:Zn-dependent protease|nr:site-2 protease family protein [Thermoanaerobaculia bacterium]